MSWSISAKGKKAEVKERLTNSRTQELSHVQGKEREIADRAVDLALEVVEATADKFNLEISMFGSASFDEKGDQAGQAVGVNCSFSLETAAS